MKMASVVVSGLGILALVVGIVEHLTKLELLSVSPGGYLRGATALYLLAVVIMIFDHNYCKQPDAAAPATKP